MFRELDEQTIDNDFDSHLLFHVCVCVCVVFYIYE